ncbi:MAG: hypothetical protein JWN14_3977 [Chthonomonadales bacterium]|nr:hypothetical protein [Chthonomonadales bacterium]
MSNVVAPEYTGFEVKWEHSFLAFLYALCPVYVEINGTRIQAKWGTQFFPAVPGRYLITCYTNYLITPQCGKNSIEVDLYQGQVVRVTWTAPLIVFMKGPMRWELITGPNPS